MRAPLFWTTENWMSNGLKPVSTLYRFFSKRHYEQMTPVRVGAPVICVGNLVAGGAGKTPVAIALMDLLKDSVKNAWFLTRGYGGCAQGPVKVDPAISNYKDVGDEPLLLAGHAPTMMAKNKLDGARACVQSDAKLIVMDDGFQNPSLTKDISFLVIDGAYGLGNERIIPAGPLRESLDDGLEHASAIIMIGEDKKNIAARIPPHIPVFKAFTSQKTEQLDKGQKIFAFAGIGRPEKFHIALRDLGFYVTGMRGFPDHHSFSPRDLARLEEAASLRDACLVTTEKDAVRLPPDFRKKVKVIGLTLNFEQPDALKSFCLARLAHG